MKSTIEALNNGVAICLSAEECLYLRKTGNDMSIVYFDGISEEDEIVKFDLETAKYMARLCLGAKEVGR